VSVFPTLRFSRGFCDLEWDTPTGEVEAFGGDVFIRASAFLVAGGFNLDLLVGEDPELALRVRQKGWIIRMAVEMTITNPT